jgi:hypothetical protein
MEKFKLFYEDMEWYPGKIYKIAEYKWFDYLEASWKLIKSGVKAVLYVSYIFISEILKKYQNYIHSRY